MIMSIINNEYSFDNNRVDNVPLDKPKSES